MISASLLQEAFPKGFRPIILVATSLLKKSVGKNQSLYFSVLSVPPWCFFFLAISTRRHGEHGVYTEKSNFPDRLLKETETDFQSPIFPGETPGPEKTLYQS